jgi:hypothetical protein
MRADQRDVLRRSANKRDRLLPVSIRIPLDLWEKCGWAAEVVGLSRTEFVRNTLTHATRDTQPPENAKSRMILASDDEWRTWQAIAEHFELPLNELMRRAANRLIPRAKALGVVLDSEHAG